RILVAAPVKTIQPQVTHHIVDIPVVIEIAGDDAVPPAMPVAYTRAWRNILEYPLFIMKHRQRHPFSRKNQVRPAVVVDVRPYSVRDHPDLLQPRSDRRRDIGELHLPIPGVVT